MVPTEVAQYRLSHSIKKPGTERSKLDSTCKLSGSERGKNRTESLGLSKLG